MAEKLFKGKKDSYQHSVKEHFKESRLGKDTYSKSSSERSGRVLDSRPRGGGFEPHHLHCVVVFEQDTFILALFWVNLGRPVPT